MYKNYNHVGSLEVICGPVFSGKSEELIRRLRRAKIANSITKLQSICTACGNDAHFSQRLINNHPAKHDDPLILMGESDKYVARCRQCYTIDKPFDYNSYQNAMNTNE